MPDTAPPDLLHGDGQVARDDSRLFEPAAAAAAGNAPLPPDEPGWRVTLATWVAHRGTLRARQHPVGIQVQPDEDLRVLAAAEPGTTRLDPHGIAFIAIVFPAYTDGRGFSLAQQLRHEHGWTGEMRAMGDVLIDTVHYLARCGFDSFVLKEGHDPRQALQAMATFTRAYQRSYPLAARDPSSPGTAMRAATARDLPNLIVDAQRLRSPAGDST